MAVLGAVACGHPVTAAAAVEILEDGGNAYDAAIAAQFTACVAEPVLTSLGGGGFLLARSSDGARVFDFFAHTPRHLGDRHLGDRRQGGADASLQAVEVDFGPATQTFHVGPGSIATPGTVAGMFAIHRQLGSLPMTRITEPAVRAARTGVPTNDFQHYIFEIVRPIYQDTHYAAVKLDRPLPQPELADTLESLALEGEDLFYRGAIGQRIIELCQQRGGHLQADDLAHYAVLERTPLKLVHRGYQVLTNPLPSIGGVLIRHALERIERTGDEPATPELIVQAMASANKHRQHLPVHDQVNRGTTHISVIDQAGNVAAMTLSNGEGSGLVVPGTGIMLNNMLGEEDINPTGIGHWTPNVRLGSMMAPTLIIGTAHQYALGSGGSNRIRSAILQVILHLLDHGQTPEAAIDAPRLHLESAPDGALLSAEPGFDDRTLTRLEALAPVDHWQSRNLFFGGVHLAGRHVTDTGLTFDAVGDPRRGGAGQLASSRLPGRTPAG